MIRLVQLINAPLGKGYRESSRTGAYPPLCIAALAGFVRAHEPGIDLELFDGEMSTTNEICQRLRSGVVGISCNILTYPSALQIAMEASERGGKVILGGPFPSSLPDKILSNRPFIDAVVVGDGEIALCEYLREEPVETIPNLCFRHGESVVRNRESLINLNSLPDPNYGALPLDRYFATFATRYADFKPFRKSLAVYSRKGCVWRDVSGGGCVFCMIPHKGIRYRSPQRMWEEIAFFNRARSVDHFWEFSDTFTENSHWIDEFLRAKPPGLDVAFSVYGRPSNISHRMARTLKDLGVYDVFIGAESGDDKILRLMNKGITVDQTRQAVVRLADQGIKVVASFVLGLPGETPETIQKTVDLATELYRTGNIVETSASIMLPIPGGNAFDLLMRVPGMGTKHSSDLLDLEELKLDWIKNFTNTNITELELALEKILQTFPLNNTFMQRDTFSAPMC